MFVVAWNIAFCSFERLSFYHQYQHQQLHVKYKKQILMMLCSGVETGFVEEVCVGSCYEDSEDDELTYWDDVGDFLEDFI